MAKKIDFEQVCSIVLAHQKEEMMRFFKENVLTFINGLLASKRLSKEDYANIVEKMDKLLEVTDGVMAERHLSVIFSGLPEIIQKFKEELNWNNGQQRILKIQNQERFGAR